MSPRHPVIAFCVALLAWAPHLAAEPGETGFVLEYMAPTACPSLTAFTDAIVRRAPNASPSAPGPGVFVFRARVEADGGLHAGRLSVESPGATTTEREVAPAACADVVETMAVIIALIVAGNDPSAPRTGAPSEPAAGASSGTVSDPEPLEASGTPNPGVGLSSAETGSNARRAGSLALDVERIDSARSALEANDAPRALGELDAYERSVRAGVLDREALLLRIDALARQGATEQMRVLARQYLGRFPDDAHAPRVRQLLGARPSNVQAFPTP